MLAEMAGVARGLLADPLAVWHLELCTLRVGKWLGLSCAASQCEPERKGSCRPAFGPKILQVAL